MTYTKNLIIQLSNIGILGFSNNEIDKKFESETEEIKHQRVTRELLMIIFKKFGTIANIQYKIGDSEGTVRFDQKSPEAAQKVLDHYATDSLLLGNQVVTMKIIQGEQEAEIYRQISLGKQKRDQKFVPKKHSFKPKKEDKKE